MIRIGKIVATHGLKGALVLVHIVGESDWLTKETCLFVELNKGSFIPFFVTEAKTANSEEYIIHLEDISQPEEAKKLVGRPVYIDENIIGDKAADTPLLWVGFKIVDKEKGALGLIDDVFQTGHQWLARINYGGKEVLIPLIDQMILDVNVRNRFIRMDLPEGLLEI